MTELPPMTEFLQQLDTLFTVQTAHGPVALKLIEAKALTSGNPPQQAPTAVSLIFINHDQPSLILSSGIYQLAHPSLGQLSLFVEPIISNKPVPNYQVIIN